MTGKMLNERLGQVQLLGDVHRVQSHVLPDAHPRRARHAAARVDVQQRSRLGHAEPDREHRLGRVRDRYRHHACSTGSSACAAAGPRPADPWGADSLEWSIASPPPEYNFAEIPIVSSRHPLWEGGAPPALPTLDDAAASSDPAVRSLALEGAFDKTSTITSGRDTRPSDVLEIPEQTVVPLVVAFGLAVFFVGLLIDASVVGVIGVAVAVGRDCAVALADRHGPDHDRDRADRSRARPAVARHADDEARPLDGVVGHGDADRDGVDGLRHPARRVLLPAGVVARTGRPAGIAAAGAASSSVPFSFVLWGSSIPIFYAEAAIRRGSQRGLRAGLLVSGVHGRRVPRVTPLKDFHDLTFGWRDNAYGSIFYLIVGLHALHVFIGLCMNVVVQIKAWQGKFSADAPHERRGVRSLLALRRRGLDLRVLVAVLVGGVAMTAAEVERHRDAHRRCDAASRSGTPRSAVSGRGSSTWCSSSPPSTGRISTRSTAGRCTPRPACARWRRSSRCSSPRRLLVVAVGQRPGVERRRRPAAVPRPVRSARRRHQSGADPARGQLRAVHSPWLSPCSPPGSCSRAPSRCSSSSRPALAYALGRDRWNRRAGRPMVGSTAAALFFAGLVDGRRRAGIAARRRGRHVALGAHDPARPAACRSRDRCSRFGMPLPTLLWALPDAAPPPVRSRSSGDCSARTIAASRCGSPPRCVAEALVMWGWHLPVALPGRAPQLRRCTRASTRASCWSRRPRGGRSRPVRRSLRGAAAVAALLGSVPGMALGAGDGARAAPVVPDLRDRQRRRPRSPNQQLAGVIMWAFGGMAAVIAGAALFASWLARRPARIDRTDARRRRSIGRRAMNDSERSVRPDRGGRPRRRGTRRPLGRRPARRVEVRRQRAQPRVPRQLVVPARRDRDVLLRHPRR